MVEVLGYDKLESGKAQHALSLKCRTNTTVTAGEKTRSSELGSAEKFGAENKEDLTQTSMDVESSSGP